VSARQALLLHARRCATTNLYTSRLHQQQQHNANKPKQTTYHNTISARRWNVEHASIRLWPAFVIERRRRWQQHIDRASSLHSSSSSSSTTTTTTTTTATTDNRHTRAACSTAIGRPRMVPSALAVAAVVVVVVVAGVLATTASTRSRAYTHIVTTTTTRITLTYSCRRRIGPRVFLDHFARRRQPLAIQQHLVLPLFMLIPDLLFTPTCKQHNSKQNKQTTIALENHKLFVLLDGRVERQRIGLGRLGRHRRLDARQQVGIVVLIVYARVSDQRERCV
jgi:hypothetical protein